MRETDKSVNQYLIYMFNMCHILFTILLGWDSKGLSKEFAPTSLLHPEIETNSTLENKKKNKTKETLSFYGRCQQLIPPLNKTFAHLILPFSHLLRQDVSLSRAASDQGSFPVHPWAVESCPRREIP